MPDLEEIGRIIVLIWALIFNLRDLNRMNFNLFANLPSSIEEFVKNLEDRITLIAEIVTKEGDPVLIPSGMYIEDALDMEIPDGSFVISRRYISEGSVRGHIGEAWMTSLDSRIIRGITKIDMNQVQNPASQASEMNAVSDFMFLDEAKEMVAEYNAAMAQYNQILAIVNRANALHALNRHALFPESPSYYEETGNESLLLIDENGSPTYFAGDGEGGWKPQSGDKKLKWRLVSIGNRGADAPEGFLLYCPAGIKKYYDTTGFLIKIEDQNGQSTIITRDASGKATKINGPHNAEWQIQYSEDSISQINGPEGQTVHYAYTGAKLTGATDTNGDTVRYSYESTGRLEKIIKPDNANIVLGYMYDGANGTKLVGMTRNEEGGSEHFDYDPANRMTVYTNHSGIKITYVYDENQRTLREVHADGTVKSYTYIPDSNLLETVNVNGNTTSFEYDARGNTTLRRYSDGTTELSTWSANDEELSRTDRDGVRTEFVYDTLGNCVEIRRGGEVVLRSTYNASGQLLENRRGNREVEHYTYDSKGYVAGRTTASGDRQVTEHWTHDGLGRTTSYTDGEGRVSRYTYRQKQQIIETPNRLKTTYNFDSRKDLVSVQSEDTATGEVREMRVDYDKRHLAKTVTDGAGNKTAFNYRDDGELAGKTQGPWKWALSYDNGGRVSAVTRSMAGSVEEYTEQYTYATGSSGGETRNVLRPLPDGGTAATSYKLDPWGRMTSVTNALGEGLTRTISAEGRILKEQGASGGMFNYRYDNSTGRLIENGREGYTAARVSYNTDGSIAAMTDRNGVVTGYEYDGRGLLLRAYSDTGEKRYSYDKASRVIREEIRSAGAGTSGTGVYYTDYAYNDSERTVTVTEGGLYKSVWYLDGWEEVIRKVDGEGNVLRWTYNGAGQLLSSTDGNGNVTRYTWNEINKPATVTFANDAFTAYTYNHLGLAVKISDGEGVVWEGTYDKAGRLWKETGRPGINKEYRYDALGRILEVRNGGETVERYTYSNRGRNVVYTDGNGSSVRYEKNEYGDMVRETNRLQDKKDYIYNTAGRFTGQLAFSGKRVQIEYRNSEGLITTRYNDGSGTTVARDAAGNIVRVENETGVIQYYYNAAGKLIRQQDINAGETTNYEYDRAGRRTRMLSGNRDVRYWYGASGELTRVFDNTQRLSVEYTYNETGQEIKRVYGNGITQETFYDRAGRTVLITEWAPSGAGSGRNILRAEGYVYDEQGRRSYNVDEAGNITKYEYDNQSRLSAALYHHTEEKAAAAKKEAELAGLNFSSDKGSPEFHAFTSAEVAKLRDILNTVSYGRGNLIQYNQHLWRETYTYDGNGNRLTKTTPWGIIRYTYDAENRLLSQGSIVYTYDKDGNLLSEKGLRRTAKYEYGGQNRMVRSEVTDLAERHTVQTEYEYDAYGRRTIAQDAGSEAMRTLYDGFTLEVIRESAAFRDGSFSTNYAPEGISTANRTGQNHTEGERYRFITEEAEAANNGVRYRQPESAPRRYTGVNVPLYGRGEAVAVNYTPSGGSHGSAAYLGKDILGSVRSVTASDAALESRYEYDAFGNPDKGDLQSGMNLGYTGKPYDGTTGMYNYGYRDYKPAAARFTTVDPVKNGNNWYAYGNNNPVSYVDLLGLSPWDKIVNIFMTLVGDVIDPFHVARPIQDPRGFKYFNGNQLEKLGGYGDWIHDSFLPDTVFGNFAEIDGLKTTFTSASGKEVDIWLWKGYYDMVFDGGWHTGGEIGVYSPENSALVPGFSGVEYGILSSSSFTMTNTRTGKTYNRPDYAGSYWINGFWNDATGSLGDLDNQWNSSDLAMTATLNFYNPADAAAYAAAVNGINPNGGNKAWDANGNSSNQPFSADVVGDQVIVTWN